MKNSKRKLLLDFHFPGWHPLILSKIDVQSIINTLKEAKVEVLVFYARCCMGYSYYNTKFGTKHPNIGEHDLLREVIDAGHRAGIRVVAYFGGLWDRNDGDLHPEWIQRTAQGKKIRDWLSYWRLCPNSGFTDLMLKQIQEVAHYEADGLFIDMVVIGQGFYPPHDRAGCFCEICQEDYRKTYGEDMPLEVKRGTFNARRFIEWRHKVTDKFLGKCKDALKKANPDIPFTHHFTMTLIDDFSYKTSKYDSILSMESGAEMDFWTPGAMHRDQSMTARFMQSFDLPGEVLVQRWGVEEPWGWGVKNKEELTLETYSALANGAGFAMIDQPYSDGQLEPYAYKILTEIYTEVESLQPWLIEREPVVDVAVLFSEEASLYYHGGIHRDASLAACKCLMENQILFQIVTPITFHNLKAKLLILPEVGCMNQDTIDKIKSFINTGGKVIFNYETSFFNIDGDKNQSNLLDYFGIEIKGKSNTEHFFVIPDDEIISQGIEAPILFRPVYLQVDRSSGRISCSRALFVEAKSAKASFQPIVLPFADGTWETPFGNHPCSSPMVETEYKSVFIFDKGIYFTAPVFSLYSVTGDPRLAKLIVNAIKTFITPTLDIEAPPFVEASAFKKGEELMLHLINHTPPLPLRNKLQTRFGAFEVEVIIRSKKLLKSVKELPTLRPIEIKDGNLSTKVRLHKALLIRFK